MGNETIYWDGLTKDTMKTYFWLQLTMFLEEFFVSVLIQYNVLVLLPVIEKLGVSCDLLVFNLVMKDESGSKSRVNFSEAD